MRQLLITKARSLKKDAKSFFGPRVPGVHRSFAKKGAGLRGLARGFTMIELMVVMALIVILATIGLVQYRQSIVYTKEAVLKDDLNKLRDAIDQYYADKNQYPPTLQDLVTSGYLRAIPRDPFTSSDSSWQTVPAEPDPNNPSTQPGIYDVKSGAEGTTIDGKSLSEL